MVGHLDKYMSRVGIEGYGPWKDGGILVQSGSMVNAGLEGQRACSCAVIFFVPFSTGTLLPGFANSKIF